MGPAGLFPPGLGRGTPQACDADLAGLPAGKSVSAVPGGCGRPGAGQTRRSPRPRMGAAG